MTDGSRELIALQEISDNLHTLTQVMIRIADILEKMYKHGVTTHVSQ